MTVTWGVTFVIVLMFTSTPAMAQESSVTPSDDLANTGIDDVQSDLAPDLAPQTGTEGGVVQVAPSQGGLSEIESAEIGQNDAEIEPSQTETTQLVTSSTEVRRAVFGLIAVAVVTAILTALYWYKTGQQARERHARQFGGRHRADLHGPVVQDQRGPWANDALHWAEEPRPASGGVYPDGLRGAPVAVRDAPAPAAPPQRPRQQAPADRPWGSGKPTWPANPPQGPHHT